MRFRPGRSHALFAGALVFFVAACDQFIAPGGDPVIPTSVEIVEGDQTTGPVGDTVPVAVRVLDAAGQPVASVLVNWTVVSGGGSVDVANEITDDDGVSRATWVLGDAAGTQEVRASVEGVDEAMISATAIAAEVTEIEVSTPTVAFGAIEDTVTVTATGTDEFGNQYDSGFTWTSSDPGVVTASNGVLVSQGNGTAEVTVSVDEVAATVQVTVEQQLGSFELEAEDDTAHVGAVVSLDATPYDPNGVVIEDTAILNTLPDPVFATSDTAVATVDGSWNVTGRGLGTVTVTATVYDSISDSIQLFFTPAASNSIVSGSSTACALDLDGQAWCWGYGAAGELGNGAFEHRAEPVAVTGGHTFVQLAGNITSFCGLTEAGEIWCWGWNAYGALGNGTSTTDGTATPQRVVGSQTFTDIDGDWYSFCALDDAGKAHCWGYNNQGGIGQPAGGPELCGGVPCATTPQPVGGTQTFTDIAMGYYHGCALDQAGDVWCWGVNNVGQFGNGTTSGTVQTEPVPGATGYGFQSLDSNWGHTCAIDADDALYCWGHNGAGRLGDGTTDDRLSPVRIGDFAAGWADVSATNGYTCGTTTADEAHCWGSNAAGRLGTGDWSGYSTPTPVQGAGPLVAVTAGFGTACGLGADGQPYCWGSEGYGGLGNGQFPVEETPLAVLGGHTFTDVTARAAHTCALDDTGAAWCWGNGFAGELGNASYDFAATPVAVTGGLSFDGITNANGYTCAWTAAGDAYCWGGNNIGQLGNGGTTSTATPTAVSGGHAFSVISAGLDHACGIDSSGAAWCWGGNGRGELGNGTYDNSSVPVAVSGGHSFVDIGAGQHHSCGLTDAGDIYCWGWDTVGQLGSTAVADTADSPTPVLVDGGHAWDSMSLGNGNHTCAIDSAGEAWCWGVGGRLGDGTTQHAYVPTPVSGGLTWASLHAAGSHTCGVTTTTETHCWGVNWEGQLGLGYVSEPVLTPTPVTGGHTFLRLSGSFGHTCGITAADQAYCWGFENYGQLGIDDLAFANAAQQVHAGFVTPTGGAPALAGHGSGTDPVSRLMNAGVRSTPAFDPAALHGAPIRAIDRDARPEIEKR